MRSLRYLLPVLLVIVTSGCGGQQMATVSGQMLVNGAPMGGFNITFHSVETGLTAFGAAGADGHYHLYQARSKEFPPGDYKVTIVPTAEIEGVSMPKVKIPNELTSASTTTLVKTVDPGANVIDLEISAQR